MRSGGAGRVRKLPHSPINLFTRFCCLVWLATSLSAGPASAREDKSTQLAYTPADGIGFRSPCRAGTFSPENGPKGELYDGCLFNAGENTVALEAEFQNLLNSMNSENGSAANCGAKLERGVSRGVLFDTTGGCGTPESEELNLITFNIRTAAADICEPIQ